MSRARLALFVPCLGARHDARASECAARLLAQTAPELVVPRGQTCCGRILHEAGRPADAARLLARMRRVFAGAGPIVTPAARCAAYVRAHAPELAARTHDLAAHLAAQPGALDRAAWDGAIHLRCESAAASPLLAAVAGLAITADAATTVVDDPADRLALTRAHPDHDVKHLAELLAEALHLVPRPPRLPRPSPAPAPAPANAPRAPRPSTSTPSPPALRHGPTVKDLSDWAFLARGPIRWRLARALLDRLFGAPVDPLPFRARWRAARRRRGAPLRARASGSDP